TGLLIADRWDGPVDGLSTLLISDDWHLEYQDIHSALFSCGEHRAEITAESGEIAEIGLGEWSCQYLESRVATKITLSPRSVAPGSQTVVWQVQALPPAQQS
ncbi:MAG: hypothetical protein AAF330_07780, partial [Pseudomonadota bacterium]